MKRANWTAYLSIVMAMTVWACSFIFTREALRSFTPITAVTLRLTLATVLLGIYGWVVGKLQKPRKEDILLFLAAGFTQPFAYFVCEAYGMSILQSPTLVSVVMSTIPLFAPIFAWLIVRERVTWNNILGIIVSMCGVLMIVLDKTEFNFKPLGIILLFCAVLAAIIYSTLLKKIPSDYSNVSIVFYVHLSCLMFLIPTFLIADLQHWGEKTIEPISIISILVLAVFASVIGYLLFCFVVRRIGVTRANAFNNIQPAITAVVMWSIFGENLPAIKWIGIFIVILGLFICQIHIKRKEK